MTYICAKGMNPTYPLIYYILIFSNTIKNTLSLFKFHHNLFWPLTRYTWNFLMNITLTSIIYCEKLTKIMYLFKNIRIILYKEIPAIIRNLLSYKYQILHNQKYKMIYIFYMNNMAMVTEESRVNFTNLYTNFSSSLSWPGVTGQENIAKYCDVQGHKCRIVMYKDH